VALVSSVDQTTQPQNRPHVVCAARGGKRSRPAVNRAIRLAKERHADLTFLFVVDTEFISHALVGPLSVVREQLRDMGEFIMATHQSRASEAGVDADYAVREGDVREQIRTYLAENDVDVIVMGRPIEETEAAVFDVGTVTNFAAALEHDHGVEVVLVGQEDVFGE
jgi:nucleotide-binding universal stress UspA family protein